MDTEYLRGVNVRTVELIFLLINFEGTFLINHPCFSQAVTHNPGKK